MKPLLSFNHPSQVTKPYRGRIVVATGHRPKKLEDGYSNLTRALITRVATEWLRQLAPRGVISGMALGWDSAVIEGCLALNIPYVGCIPFEGQEKQWPGPEQFRYNLYRRKAARVVVCATGGYERAKMMQRNERMITLSLKDGPENALVLALWNGEPSGTKNAIHYAQTKGISIINCWNHYQTFTKR
jgi:uncharacterized phage-like protein YoqJ